MCITLSLLFVFICINFNNCFERDTTKQNKMKPRLCCNWIIESWRQKRSREKQNQLDLKWNDPFENDVCACPLFRYFYLTFVELNSSFYSIPLAYIYFIYLCVGLYANSRRIAVHYALRLLKSDDCVVWLIVYCIHSIVKMNVSRCNLVL